MRYGYETVVLQITMNAIIASIISLRDSVKFNTSSLGNKITANSIRGLTDSAPMYKYRRNVNVENSRCVEACSRVENIKSSRVTKTY